MEKSNINHFLLLAEAFRYPDPGRLSALQDGLIGSPDGRQKAALQAFADKIRRLALGEWEELYTRTFDLNPPAAPYVGFQTWGESYQRGVFLSRLSRELVENGVDPGGELADHLVPVLRYLGQVSTPLPELVEVLVPAIQRMAAVLRKAEPDNPYLYLLEAAELACNDLKKEAA